MDIKDILGKKCCICVCSQSPSYNTNLHYLSYNHSPFKLYFHPYCKPKLIYYLTLIFKNQDKILQINLDDLDYFENDLNYNSDYNDLQFSKLITTKFLYFTKIYNIMELIKQIQLNDPLYHILLIVSTWFDY